MLIKKKGEAELGHGSFTFPRSLLFFFCPEFFFKESSWLRKTVSTPVSGNSETIWQTHKYMDVKKKMYKVFTFLPFLMSWSGQMLKTATVKWHLPDHITAISGTCHVRICISTDMPYYMPAICGKTQSRLVPAGGKWYLPVISDICQLGGAPASN